MSLSVRISAFNAQSEGAKNALCGFQFVSKFLKFQQRFDPGEQFLGKYWLTEEIIRTGFDPTHPVFTLC